MRGFKAGSFDRDQMPKTLRRFSPSEALDTIEAVDLEGLRAAGKSVILLDVDNTLLPWRSKDIPAATHEWLHRAKLLGFSLCALSNTRNPERLQTLTQAMEIDYVRDKFKPSTRMYEIALEKLGVGPEAAVMVGDQLLTDVLGANRAGIDAIWIRPMGEREFVGTRYFSRNMERIVGRFLYKYFQADETLVGHRPSRPGLFEHNLFREFVKFVLVGGTSTVVDLGLHYFLMHKAVIGGTPVVDSVGRWALALTQPGAAITAEAIQNAAFAPLKVGPVVLAILNSYYWNSKWTFRVSTSEGAGARIAKFFAVALVGMVLNVVISSGVYAIARGSDDARWTVASLIAMVIVVFWNFAGQKLWTFRK